MKNNVLDPRLDFGLADLHEDDLPVVECFLCGRPAMRNTMNRVEEANYPVLYMHSHCGVGRSVGDVRRQYLGTVRGLFGGTPPMLQ